MQVGQRLIVIQEPRLRHQIRHHVARPGSFGFEMRQMLAPERSWSVCRIVDEELLDPGRPVGRWHPCEGQVAIGLEVAPVLFERRPAFLIDQPGGCVAPGTFGIGDGWSPVRFYMQRPT